MDEEVQEIKSASAQHITVELTRFLNFLLTLHFGLELSPLPTTPGLVARCSGGNLDPRCGSRICDKTPAVSAGGLSHILQVKFLLCTNFSKAKILGGADDVFCHRREPLPLGGFRRSGMDIVSAGRHTAPGPKFPQRNLTTSPAPTPPDHIGLLQPAHCRCWTA